MQPCIEKTIYFYKLHLDKGLFLQNDNKYFISKTFKQGDSYPVKENRIIDILEVSDSYVFGSIGKFETPSKLALKRLRNPNTYETVKSLGKLQEILEDFTYFLIGNNFRDVVVLNNSNAPTLNSTLAKLLKKQCQELNNAYFSPVPITDLKGKLNSFTEILKVSFATEHTEHYGFIPSIAEIQNLSEDAIDKVTISLCLKSEIGNKKFIDALCESKYEGYSSFKVSGIPKDNNLLETIDLIRKILTKKVSIEITNDTLTNNEKIKQILLNELLNNIK